MSEHTPGPWSQRRSPDKSGYMWRWSHWIDAPRNTPIAEIRDIPEAEANARLIAAAPELLEAARAAEVLMRPASDKRVSLESLEVHGALKAAIAKAEGRDHD